MFLDAKNSNQETEGPRAGILDAVMESEQAQKLSEFNPSFLVSDFLNQLRERERRILSLRYGLSENKQHTLEAIGKKLNLTRERVRQVEKDSMKALNQAETAHAVGKAMDVVRKTISDHGGIFEQAALVDHLLIANNIPSQVNSLLFLLELSDLFIQLRENEDFHLSWHVADFHLERFTSFHGHVREILNSHGQPLDFENLHARFKGIPHYREHEQYYTPKVIENLLRVAKSVKANPFGEYGLKDWRVIQPKDVGDKAYLVLKHQKQPLHYTKITELINQHDFDSRTAYKETVHNELIMDERFVLVGRGIYALTEWGYKKGLVADVIKDILANAPEPMDRNKLVEEVLKQRVVRRNTILVGLANRQLFRKVGRSKYTLA